MPLSANPGDEETLWQGAPSVKALLGDIVAGALFTLAVALGVYVLYAPALRLAAGLGTAAAAAVATNEPGLRLAAILFVVTVVGLRLGRVAWRVLALRSYRYKVSNQRVLIESGVFSSTIEEIDMRTVEDITFHQSFLERLLGIGQIGLVSSDRTTARVRLVGVENPRQVRELVRNSAYKASGGQLFTRQT
jgi:uncharacterized membrane protein YdbT with pleckstrin-like domain